MPNRLCGYCELERLSQQPPKEPCDQGEYRIIESLDGISVGLGSNPITPLQFMSMENAILICNLLNGKKERKVSLEEIKIIKSVLDYYNLPENGFYTDVISEEIAKRLNATEERKGEEE